FWQLDWRYSELRSQGSAVLWAKPSVPLNRAGPIGAQGNYRWRTQLMENCRSSSSGVREHEDRHGLDLLGLQCAVERRHNATTSAGDRRMYRGAVRAPEI